MSLMIAVFTGTHFLGKSEQPTRFKENVYPECRPTAQASSGTRMHLKLISVLSLFASVKPSNPLRLVE